MHANIIAGTIPSTVGSLSQLQILGLINSLSGIYLRYALLHILLAVFYCYCIYLYVITIGVLPSSLGCLLQLNTLNLYNNKLTGRNAPYRSYLNSMCLSCAG